MTSLSARFTEVQNILLELVSRATDVPIALCDLRRDKDGHPHFVGAANHPFTRDHCRHALGNLLEEALEIAQVEERAICCDATRTCTLAVPVKVQNKMWALLLYGAQQVDESQWAGLQQLEAAGGDAVQDAYIDLLELSTAGRASGELKNLLREAMEVLYSLASEQREHRHMITDIAHALRTYLTGLIGEAAHLDTDLEGLGVDGIRRRIKNLMAAANAMDTVTQTLVEDHKAYTFGAHSMAYLVSEALTVYEAEARYAGLEFSCQFQPGSIPHVEISRRHLQLALNHLVHNAVKYSFPGTWVRIEGHPDIEQGEYHLTIENIGYAVPEEVMTGDVQQGQRGKPIPTHVRIGAGRGIPFVRQVIERHKGRICISSVQDTQQGPNPTVQEIPWRNRVCVRLPLRQAGPDARDEGDKASKPNEE